jgi:hypothetical protein
LFEKIVVGDEGWEYGVGVVVVVVVLLNEGFSIFEGYVLFYI